MDGVTEFMGFDIATDKTNEIIVVVGGSNAKTLMTDSSFKQKTF